MSGDVEKYGDTWRRAEEAVGGRWQGGAECPPVTDLFLAAASDEVSNNLREHLEHCPACRRTFYLAGGPGTQNRRLDAQNNKPNSDAANRSGSHSKRPNAYLVSEEVRVPIIAKFAGGCIRCLVGKTIIILFLQPKVAGSDWGRNFSANVSCRSGKRCLASDSADERFRFSRGDTLQIKIEDNDRSDEIAFDWEGWGAGIQFLSVLRYRGLKLAESTLVDSEAGDKEPVVRVSRETLNGEDEVAKPAFEQLWRIAKGWLRLRLESWTEIGRIESRYIDEALSLTAMKAFQDRRHIPNHPEMRLLELATTTLLEILVDRSVRIPEGVTYIHVVSRYTDHDRMGVEIMPIPA